MSVLATHEGEDQLAVRADGTLAAASYATRATTCHARTSSRPPAPS
ncbi:hypothetical protein [Streptomyces sp. SS52]|nr:hypothetical protein [Streptomyces sp. SS52]